jgi:hypothetical protein
MYVCTWLIGVASGEQYTESCFEVDGPAQVIETTLIQAVPQEQHARAGSHYLAGSAVHITGNHFEVYVFRATVARSDGPTRREHKQQHTEHAHSSRAYTTLR